MSKASKTERLPTEIVRTAVERVLASDTFRRSERMRRFLKFCVDQSLASGGELKEYAVALAVYDKASSFDPRVDPIVRVEASRLRSKLRQYYDEEGSEDPVIISIRKGGYSAIFRKQRIARLAFDSMESPSESNHLYLMGNHYWNKQNSKSLMSAIDCFRAAIESDSAYAQAYAGLAKCHSAQAWLETCAPTILWPEVERQALNAQALEATAVEARSALAFKKAVFDWKWKDSETAFRESLSFDPHYATAHHWYGFFCLSPQRRLKAALQEVALAATLDPLSPTIATHLGCLLYFRRAYAEAAEQLNHVLKIDPTFHLAYSQLGFVQIQLSQFEQAEESFREAKDLGWSEPAFLAALGYLHATRGDSEKAKASIQMINCLSQHTYVSPVCLALVHGALREIDGAFQCLYRAIDERSSGLIHIKIEPAFDSLKTDQRFIDVLKKLDLVD